MITQKSIDYTPHSRPKRYFLLLPQLRSAVQPDSRTQRLWLKDEGYIPYRGIAILGIIAAVMFLLLNLGAFNFIYEVMK